ANRPRLRLQAGAGCARARAQRLSPRSVVCNEPGSYPFALVRRSFPALTGGKTMKVRSKGRVGLFAVAIGLLMAASIPPSAQVPAVPKGLTATVGNTQVGLRWTPSAGATSYHLKRSTASGGPYAQVAAPAWYGYTDVSRTNGVTYFYVVSAVNASGE